MQSTDSEKKTLINKTKRLKAFVLLVLLHLGISLTRAQLREASPPLQREVSEQSSHRLYSTQAFLILCVNWVTIETTMSVFGSAFLLEFSVILKSSFAIDQIQSGVGTGFQANFPRVFNRGTESLEDERHTVISLQSLLLVATRSLRKGEIMWERGTRNVKESGNAPNVLFG